MKVIESERITNISDYEKLIINIRSDFIFLKKALRNENTQASKKLLEQIDLKLHELEAYEFQIERRVITEDCSSDNQ